MSSSDSPFSPKQYVDPKTHRIKAGALIGTLFSAFILAGGSAVIAAIERFVLYQTRAIRGFGEWVSGGVETLFGDAAGLLTQSWAIALAEAIEYGPLAPFMLAVEAVIVLLIVWALWERSPYGGEA